MNNYNKTVVGLDVHKETIVMGLLPEWSEKVTETARLENTPNAVENMVKRLGGRGPIEFVYEAGPCGYEVQRQMQSLGYSCFIVAPGLIPKKATDRVKTDRRDAEKLARLWRAGELTEIRVPTMQEEADRDLVRLRESSIANRLRAQHRLGKFLLRHGRIYREAKAWGWAHKNWLAVQKFEYEASQRTFEGYMRSLQDCEEESRLLDQQVQDLAESEAYRTKVQYLRALKGINTISAITLLVEAQDLLRFKNASGFMKFTGLTSWESSSGNRVVRGGISKAGNAHIRRILVESAWSYRSYKAGAGSTLAKKRKGCPVEILSLAKKAQERLHRKFYRMRARGKASGIAVTAVARELAGFVWFMARHFPKTA